MSIRDIVTLPDQSLRQVSKPVARIDVDIRRLWDDMLETMYAAPGIGLAAIQVGAARRLLVADLAKEGEEKKPLFVANPEIVWQSETQSDYEEGCLSIPEFYEMVSRPSEVTVRYLDRQGEAQQIHATGLLATCLQHEIDHLNGKLFPDRISRIKRNLLMRKVKKAITDGVFGSAIKPSDGGEAR